MKNVGYLYFLLFLLSSHAILASGSDFDGDDHDDVLLRHADGRWYFYAMDGSRYAPDRRGYANLTPNLDWRFAAFGDFDGDGNDDVLLRHLNGRWFHYGMNGGRYISRGLVNLTTDLDWQLVDCTVDL